VKYAYIISIPVTGVVNNEAVEITEIHAQFFSGNKKRDRLKATEKSKPPSIGCRGSGIRITVREICLFGTRLLPFPNLITIDEGNTFFGIYQDRFISRNINGYLDESFDLNYGCLQTIILNNRLFL
jgi:hypothetical protein